MNVDPQHVIDSLARQVAEMARRIAVLEAALLAQGEAGDETGGG